MKSRDESAAGSLLGVVLGLVLMAVFTLGSAMVGGFVLSKLWLWHAVSALGVPALPFRNAAGLALALVVVLAPRVDCRAPERTPAQSVARLVGLLAFPWVALLVGWVLA